MNSLTAEVSHVKVGTKIQNKHTYKFCVTHFLKVNSYKMATVRNFEVRHDKFNVYNDLQVLPHRK